MLLSSWNSFANREIGVPGFVCGGGNERGDV